MGLFDVLYDTLLSLFSADFFSLCPKTEHLGGRQELQFTEVMQETYIYIFF